jgi:hypothetical protein
VYFRALAQFEASVTAVFQAGPFHNERQLPSKGWRKNVEEIEHLHDFRFGVCRAIRSRASQSTNRKFRLD